MILLLSKSCPSFRSRSMLLSHLSQGPQPGAALASVSCRLWHFPHLGSSGRNCVPFVLTPQPHCMSLVMYCYSINIYFISNGSNIIMAESDSADDDSQAQVALSKWSLSWLWVEFWNQKGPERFSSPLSVLSTTMTWFSNWFLSLNLILNCSRVGRSGLFLQAPSATQRQGDSQAVTEQSGDNSTLSPAVTTPDVELVGTQ